MGEGGRAKLRIYMCMGIGRMRKGNLERVIITLLLSTSTVATTGAPKTMIQHSHTLVRQLFLLFIHAHKICVTILIQANRETRQAIRKVSKFIASS